MKRLLRLEVELKLVSIRHQPEYLPSHHVRMPEAEITASFQSGISLSICLHEVYYASGGGHVPRFQSGISLSICLHVLRFFEGVMMETLMSGFNQASARLSQEGERSFNQASA